MASSAARFQPGDPLWREPQFGGAKVTFHPAGHVLGSAQIAVEAGDLRVVASGDYKNVLGASQRFDAIARRSLVL